MSYDCRNKEDVDAFMVGYISHIRHFMYLTVNYANMDCFTSYEGKPIKNINLN